MKNISIVIAGVLQCLAVEVAGAEVVEVEVALLSNSGLLAVRERVRA